MKDFHHLFIEELRDIYSAEVQIETMLPAFAKAAHETKLKDAFRQHHDETKQQIVRLKKIAKNLHLDLEGRTCHAMKGILEEGQKMLLAQYPEDVLDAALISAAQRVEHYEMAVYGTLKNFAKHLGLKEVEELLDETFCEEKHADKKLSGIATGNLFHEGINEKAISHSI